MSWSKFEGGAYPPQATGDNLSGTVIAVYSGNATDSVASDDIDVFVTAKHGDNAVYPNPIYDTGALTLDAAEAKLTNDLNVPYSFVIEFNGEFTSNSTSNSALISHRLNSSGGIGTGTKKTDSAGPTGGTSTVATGFGTVGAFTLQAGESVWLEVSKNVSGTLVLADSLVIVRPIWQI